MVLTSHELANALAATGMPYASRGCIWMHIDAIAYDRVGRDGVDVLLNLHTMDEDHAEDAGDDTPSHDNERRFMVEKKVLENHKKYIEIHQSCDGNWVAPCAEICNDMGVSSKNVSSDT